VLAQLAKHVDVHPARISVRKDQRLAVTAGVFSGDPIEPSSGARARHSWPAERHPNVAAAVVVCEQSGRRHLGETPAYIFDLLATSEGYRWRIPTSFISASISSISMGRCRLSHSTPVAVTTNMSSMRM